MRWPLALVAIVLLSGCRSTSCELVERELAESQDDVRVLEEELAATNAHLRALEGQLSSVQGIHPHKPILAHSPIHKISLGRLTSGLDSEPGDGDDALQVLLIPEDPLGHAIKIPGTALVQAFEIAPNGTKQPLTTWNVNSDQLATSWRSGLLSTGYSLILPFKTPPSTDKLRVVVRLQIANGRVFEVDKDVTIRVPSYRKNRMPTADETLPAATVLPPIMPKASPEPPFAPELPMDLSPPAPKPTEQLPVMPRPQDPVNMPPAPTPVELVPTKPAPEKDNPVPPIPTIAVQPEAKIPLTIATSAEREPIAQSKRETAKIDR